jgi:hypothetical protein
MKSRENIRDTVEVLSRTLLSMSEFLEMTYKMAGETGSIRRLSDLRDYFPLMKDITESTFLLSEILVNLRYLEEGEE